MSAVRDDAPRDVAAVLADIRRHAAQITREDCPTCGYVRHTHDCARVIGYALPLARLVTELDALVWGAR